jgi:putative IMPACT (imprinted ancient) family translation regulator
MALTQLPNVLSDRGSQYAVTGALAETPEAVEDALKDLRRAKKFAKATHNSWAVLLPDGTPLKSDDGEAGAGNVILRMLEREGLTGQLLIVTRWYGGKHLGGDRFRHIQTCVRAWLVAHGPDA